MDGLVLRGVVPADVARFFEHQLDPVARRMAAFTAEGSTDRTVFEARWDVILADPSIAEKAIVVDDEVVGYLVCFDRTGEREVGYWIARSHWGRGIATAALRSFLDQLAARPLHACAAQDNRGSLRVLEKCGFAFLREEPAMANARGGPIVGVHLRLAWDGVPIRAVERRDAAAWERMRQAFWPSPEGEHAGEIAAYLDGDRRIAAEVLLALDDAERPIGFAELSIRPYAEGCRPGRVGYLEGWYVEPEHRRRGIGRALVAAAERWGRYQGCTELGSDTAVENLASASAHRALGFDEVDRLIAFRRAL